MTQEGVYEVRFETKDVAKYNLGRVETPAAAAAPPYYGFGGFAPNTHFWQPTLPDTDDS
jgi:hypothetical protein